MVRLCDTCVFCTASGPNSNASDDNVIVVGFTFDDDVIAVGFDFIAAFVDDFVAVGFAFADDVIAVGFAFADDVNAAFADDFGFAFDDDDDVVDVGFVFDDVIAAFEDDVVAVGFAFDDDVIAAFDDDLRFEDDVIVLEVVAVDFPFDDNITAPPDDEEVADLAVDFGTDLTAWARGCANEDALLCKALPLACEEDAEDVDERCPSELTGVEFSSLVLSRISPSTSPSSVRYDQSISATAPSSFLTSTATSSACRCSR